MFGRNNKKKTAPVAPADVARYQREDLHEACHAWAEEALKRPYQAAGFDLDAAIKHVHLLEEKASGSSGHPWPPQLKFQMVTQINGADSLPEVKKRVERLQLDYERALRAEDEPADDEEV